MSIPEKLSSAFPGKQWRISLEAPTYANWEWLDGGQKPSRAAFDAALAAVDPPPPDLGEVNNLDRSIKALALTFAQITGTPVATVRTIFRQKWDSLG